MLKVEGLTAGYGRLQVLLEVSSLFSRREISVIVGPNGSGKSTLLKSIFGLTKIYSGSIKLEGHELVGLAPHEIAKRAVAYLPQTENIFEPLTIKENFVMAGYLRDEKVADKTDSYTDMFPVLKDRMRKKAGTLSGGERQMLAMAMAVIREPTVILFDEPTANLAPIMAREVFNKIVELRDTLGITPVIVEQNAKRALQMADTCYLLVGGKVAFEGKPCELLANPELSRLYLGVKAEA